MKTKKNSKNKREEELKTLLEVLFLETNNKPKFSVYILEPEPNSAQRTTGVLTVAIEQDKFRIEQCISKMGHRH